MGFDTVLSHVALQRGRSSIGRKGSKNPFFSYCWRPGEFVWQAHKSYMNEGRHELCSQVIYQEDGFAEIAV